MRGCWRSPPTNGMTPSCTHLYRVAGPPDTQVRRSSQISELFDRLMRRSISPWPILSWYRRVWPPLPLRTTSEQHFGHTHKHQEGPGKRDEPTVQSKPACDGRHGKLPNAVVDVITAVVRTRYWRCRRPNRAVRTRKVQSHRSILATARSIPR